MQIQYSHQIIKYLCSAANVRQYVGAGRRRWRHIFRFKSLKIHDDRVHCGYEKGDMSAIALRSVNPSDSIATNILSRRIRSMGRWCNRRFETDSFSFDEDARVIHFNNGPVNRFGSLFAHEIINDTNAVLFQITSNTLTYVYEPLHFIFFLNLTEFRKCILILDDFKCLTSYYVWFK